MNGTCIRIKGLKRYTHPKTGITYTYHRKSGRRIEAELGTPAFLLEIAKIEADLEARAKRAPKETLGAYIRAYRESDDWRDLAPRTKSDYGKILDFLQPLADQPAAKFTPAELAKLRDKWRKGRGRRFVNYTLTVLSIVLGRAVEAGVLNENPLLNVKRIKKDKSAAPQNRPWTPEERRAVWNKTREARYAHLNLPLALGLYLGVREGDMITMPRTAIQGERLQLETNKRKVWIDLPVLPELANAISRAKGDRAIVTGFTLCVNSRGTPWTLNGFRRSFFKMVKELEKAGYVEPGLTYHGLRHTVASLLAEGGVGYEDIAAVLGQKSSEMAAHYAARADRSRRAGVAMERLRPLSGPGEQG